MLRLRNILIHHKVAIILAFLTAIIASLPQVYFRIDHKDDGVYQGIELLPDSPWSARAREVQDGHPNFGAIYYQDGKDDPYLFQPLGSMVVGYMGKIFSLDINDTLLLSRFVLSFIASLLLYCFVFLFSKEKSTALSSAAVLLLADSILSYSGLARLFQGVSPDSFLRLSRPVNPAMIYILLFSFLICFLLFYQKRNIKYGVLSSLFLGLNFYNYFYSWTYLYAFGALLVLIYLLQKKWQEALRIGSVFVGALIVAIPYFINLYKTTVHPAYEEASVRFGVVVSHSPVFVGTTVIFSLIIFLFFFPKENRERYFFGLALVLAPFVTMNQQILTGKVLQEDHYHWFFHKPVAFILVCTTVFYVVSRRKMYHYRDLIVTVLVVASVLVALFVQMSSYFYDHRDGGMILLERQKYGEVMDWLNANSKKEEVVFSNDEISHITVIYTPLNLFYHRAGIYALSSTEKRLLDTLFTFYILRGVGMKEVDKVFFDERGYISDNVYGIYYRELLGSYEAIPDEKIQNIIDLYKVALRTPRSQWLEQVLTTYNVGYVVWDKKSDPSWQLDQYIFLNKAVDFGDVSVYTLLNKERIK
ncbi:MAG: hypothetical protein RJA61_580 [Candidatus Parcubacteria bacterium]|jgi:hypothetical protein